MRCVHWRERVDPREWVGLNTLLMTREIKSDMVEMGISNLTRLRWTESLDKPLCGISAIPPFSCIDGLLSMWFPW